MEHHKSSDISAQAPASLEHGLRTTPTARPVCDGEVPDVRRRLLRMRRDVALLLCLAVFFVGGTILVLVLSNVPGPFVSGPTPAAPAPASGDWSQTPVTDAEKVCARFIRLKNAGDPTAVGLLGPAPAVPDAPVSKAEADAFQTDSFLRQDVRFVGVGRDRQTGALVLYARGNVSAPTLRVKGADGVESIQRVMANPDLTVEVRGGRIYGVSSDLHHGG